KGIGVMIGTPTAAPPAWLTSKYPEVLRTEANGQRKTHGQRRHYSPYSATYRRLSAGIVRKMAEELSDHPALHSWQIDNELSGQDYGPEARQYFHHWLAQRYGTVENLNRTWGLEFWSQAYDRFDQVPMAQAAVGSIEVPERHHPSLIFAVARCNNDAWTEFIRSQCDIIRETSDKPITTNMTSGLAMKWFQHNRLLDRVGHSLYKDVEHYPWNIMYFDRMRAEKPAPYWLLETAPNWSGGGKQWNIHHSPAGVKAMSWMSTALGGSMVLYWQWRQHWAGQEMQHGTHLTATGKWRPNKRAWTELAGEFDAHGNWLLANPPSPAGVGIVLSNEASWGFAIDPIDNDMRYAERWRDDYHLPMLRSHIWRDVISDEDDLDRYKVLCVPLMRMISPDTRKRLIEWVNGGGKLLLGPLSGTRTEEWTTPRDQEFCGLEEIIGAESSLRFTVHWQEDLVNVEFADGHSTRSRNWCEAFAPTTGEAIAHYRGGYGDGEAAIIRNQAGEGEVITLGCQVSDETYVKLLGELMSSAGLSPVAEGSSDVLVVPRGGSADDPAGWAVVNLTEASQQVKLPAGGTDRLTGRTVDAELTLEPLEVLLIER
ncbi:MAG: beta-galactosidase, partial [Planctomycetota bacterium]